MKQPARKSSPLSLVPAATERATPAREESQFTLESYFDGWLEAVGPTLNGTEDPDGQPRQRVYGRSLTSKDVTRVNRATVRESNAHRHWPREVVLSFLAADVITKK